MITIPLWLVPWSHLLVLLVCWVTVSALAKIRLAASERTWDQAIRHSQFQAKEAIEVAQHLKELLEPLERALETERVKSAGYFTTIESVLKQRQTWEELYTSQAVEHGNAQALMMDAIGYLTNRLKQAGLEVKIPPLLQEVQGMYQEGHVFPVTSGLRATNQHPIDMNSPKIPGDLGKGSGRVREPFENTYLPSVPPPVLAELTTAEGGDEQGFGCAPPSPSIAEALNPREVT